jgi:diguanylate cyclase (GGDEF)-like protein/PAS domain S-box-containing protein
MSHSDEFSDLFAAEVPQAKASVDQAVPPWKVLLVDDEEDIHAVLHMALKDVLVEGRPLQLFDAKSTEEAKALLKDHADICLILLDVVMETELAGLSLVQHIRRDICNRMVQIVLVTGQPGYAPQREVVSDYEIDGYRLKSELTADKIFVSVYAALRTYRALRDSELQRRELESLAVDLRERDGQLRLAASVYANSYEGIIIADASAKIIDVNPAFTRITGYSRDEVAGHNPRVLASGRHDPAFYRRMWASIKDHDFWQGEVCNRRKSGDLYTEILSLSVTRDEVGQLQHYIGVFSDISLLKAHEEELHRIAHYDQLTGIPNRRLLSDRLAQALARSRRTQRSVAVCYLDLDGFKAVNDRFGHAGGDKLLVTITERLRGVLRTDDTLARLGGDEFVLLLTELGQSQECRLALDRVLAIVKEPLKIEDKFVAVSASIGVSLYPDDDVDADTLLRHADQAMYLAKEGGKNSYHFFDPEHDHQIQTHRLNLQRLREALARGEFVLYYQPKADLASGEIIGAEALIRWEHPDKGLLAPSAFLNHMEGSDLEVAVGEWVIDSVLKQIARWKVQGLSFTVSANISADHLLSDNFAARLQQLLHAHPDVAPSSLELEILETAALADMKKAVRTITECRKLGVQFALDDFGTGYSSLTYFLNLPVQLLKIDQSFVRVMLEDPGGLGIVESVVRLAQAFNRPVIAEGVETLEHGSMLMHLGCRLAQGYGIAKPMPTHEFPQWMRDWQRRCAWKTIEPQNVELDVTLLVAAQSHRAWVERVQWNVEHPKEASSFMADDSNCSFGRWFDGSGVARYAKFGAYKSIGELHDLGHALAIRALELARAGDSTSAQSALQELFNCRDQLLSLLTSLNQNLAGPSSSARGPSAAPNSSSEVAVP